MSKLTNIEINVLAVALDHMEEHLQELNEPHPYWIKDRLDALKTLKAKLL